MPIAKMELNNKKILSVFLGIDQSAFKKTSTLKSLHTIVYTGALAAGTIKLVDTFKDKIFNFVVDLLDNNSSYECMSSAINPYGDGTASKRIV
jgi:hypothetical protein